MKEDVDLWYKGREKLNFDMKDLYNLIQHGKIKRFFRVRNKLNYPGLVSHITQRATGKEPLFIEEGDYLYMLKLLKELSIDFSFDVLRSRLWGTIAIFYCNNGKKIFQMQCMIYLAVTRNILIKNIIEKAMSLAVRMDKPPALMTIIY